MAYYDYPKEPWKHLRTTNPVESPFASVRLRTSAAKRYKRVENATAMIWKLLMIAERSFRKVNAPELMAPAAAGATYINGGRQRRKKTRRRSPPEPVYTPLDMTSLRAAWMAGDFGVIARYSEAEAAAFVDRLPIAPGARVLDLACGTGNLAIPAARRGAVVTGCDIASNLLEQARLRAETEGLEIRFDEADAEALPYSDADFDMVVSMLGVMFAPRPHVAAAELLRVCRPGGLIALANWTPEGFMGQMSQTVATHFPPSPTPPAASIWGNEASVRELLGEEVSEVRFARRLHRFDFPFNDVETVELMRRYVGPFQRAFASLDAEEQSRLQRDLEAHWAAHNRATDGTTEVDAEYLEVLASRR